MAKIGYNLVELLVDLNREEARRLSPLACLSGDGIRRQPEDRMDYRQSFAQDCDRILHSRAYARYIDKTQVFSLVSNDHISHRVLHVQLVARIARTIGRFLRLNEDLIEAIALGHDIGHPPFGHEGERILDTLCRRYGLAGFFHNIQSVQFLDRVERRGRGWNLCLQVLDGILCHDGEAHTTRLVPQRTKDFSSLDREIREKECNPLQTLFPMTLEGCVVRMADTIAYIGRDIEDAIELGLIDRCEIPRSCAEKLGVTNGTIVFSLVTDLLTHSRHVRDEGPEAGRDYLGFGRETADLLLELKAFNYERIYHNPACKPDLEMIRACYCALFEHFMHILECESNKQTASGIFFTSMTDEYRDSHSSAAIVRDYLAGMTDDFFLEQAREIGCPIPERT
ncbi:MAG TPA: HD domain-containing protein [Desulfobulbaceae bacterium]|nr:HD domain-containing protein [Desulfobulbaceae bacterium]